MIEFHIPSIRCGGCIKGITRAVLSVDAQAKVQADLHLRQVQVETTQDREAIAAALVLAGYRPQ